MQKLLLQLDTSAVPSVFDRIVGFDGGADQVLAYGNVSPDNVRDIVHGAIFTRGPQELRHTAIFLGGPDVGAAERVLDAISTVFFGPFRVSLMLDPNGANTTAVAAVARIHEVTGDLRGHRVLVMAGSGPVGSRVAGLLAREGADVTVTTRQRADGAVSARINQRFDVTVAERTVASPETAAEALRGAEIIVNAGPAGTCLVPRSAWTGHDSLRVVVDLNAVPPAGIEGVEPGDKATERDGVLAFGAIGVGGLKMKIHRASVARLFEQNDLVLDAEAIASIARDLSTRK